MMSLFFCNNLNHRSRFLRLPLKVVKLFKTVLFLVALAASMPSSAEIASWSGFGGAEITNEVFTFPSSADSWAGFANTNDNLYPLSLPSGGIITFTAAASGSVDVRFRFERLPYPEVDPAYNTSSVTVSGATETIYSVAIPAQSSNSYRSIILYLNDRNSPVTIKNVQVTANNNQAGCNSAPQSNGVIQVEAECHNIEEGTQTENTSDFGGGQNVGYIDAYDSMTYVVNVPTSRNYRLDYRIASLNGSTPGFRVFIDNEYTDIFSIPSTGGWQNWQTQQGRVVTLSSGAHTLKFDAASAGMNINWFSLTPTNTTADQPPQNGNGGDVDGLPVDSAKWFHQTRLPNGSSWFNNEIQHYTDRLDNSYISDGTLKIVARKEAYTDQGVTKQHTSARLNSKFAFQYGRVEFRAKMPIGAGTWPAVWMLGKNISEQGTYWASQGFGTTIWPDVGEIDILEHWGNNQGYAQSAMHTTSSNGATVNHGGRNIANISSQFHTYSMDWNASRIIFKIDGIEHYRYDPSVKNADTWPYDAEFFLLLNVAIQSDIPAGFTQSPMEVDYIRVYQPNTNNIIWSDEFNNEMDTDGDGVFDAVDDFPNDASESVDTDSDGVGDNSDAFPNNSNETADTDGDGVGDNADAFPNNANETADSDGDGVGNNADLFPFDANETIDSDGDGVGNNADAFPSDPTETVDTDGDGIGDNADQQPLNPDNSSELQIISVSNNPVASRSTTFTLQISYDVSSNNNALTGLGLRVHYDSSKLTFNEVSNYLAKDNILNGSVSEPDTDNYDGNPVTDRFISVAWASILGDWPSVSLPTNLLSIDFTVGDAIAQQFTEYTTIGFSKSSNAQGFVFSANSYELQISPASWDFDNNGTADALTDGLLMLRHAFGLTGDSLLNGAIAANSPLTGAQVEQSIISSMAIADIDNNGQVDALTDGLLLLRYLFGIKGATLVDGAVAPGASRTTHSEIEHYIQDHMPGENMVEPDTTPPQITLNGNQSVGLAIGDNYVESGAEAIDTVDGDVVVTITGSIGAQQGTYLLTYSAVDDAGNASSVTRTIVVDQAPNISSFSFLSANNPSLSNDVFLNVGSNSITGRIAENVSVKQLVATFSHDGSNVMVSASNQVNGSTANDFTQPVEYKVEKASGVGKTYAVDLTKFTGLPIINITTDNFVPIESKEDYVTGSVSVDGGRNISDMDSMRMEIRGRGNSTWGHPKKPYQMKLESKEEFLDMPKDKKWIFLAEYSDKSLLRNTTAFEMGYLSSLDWTAQSEFAEVYINNQYAGMYNITQKVEQKSNRVDVGNDGYLLEVDQISRLDSDDVYFTTDEYSKTPYWSPGSTVIAIKNPEIEQVDINGVSFSQDDRYIYINNYINQFEDVLFASNFASSTSGYAAYIDVESFIDWYLINEIVKNVDARYFSSIYFHLVPGEKIKMGPLWDHDLGFGNVDYADSQSTNGWWIRENPWINRLFDDPAFVTQVKAKFDYYRDNEQLILDKIDAYAENLQWAQEENYTQWPTLGEYVWPNPVYYDTYEEEVDHLKQWYQNRMNWLDSAINSL